MRDDQIIIAPVLSEKSNKLREYKSHQYTFKVHPKSNKHQIIYAVKNMFKVDPVSCSVLIVKGKKKANVPISATSHKKGYGKTALWKKAVVTLPLSQKIEIFEGV